MACLPWLPWLPWLVRLGLAAESICTRSARELGFFWIFFSFFWHKRDQIFAPYKENDFRFSKDAHAHAHAHAYVMAGICPGEFDEDFMSVYGGDGNIKAQPMSFRRGIFFEDSNEEASLWLVAVKSPSPTLHLHVELRAVFNCGKERKVATLAFSQRNLECVGADLVDGLKLKARFSCGKSVRFESKKNEKFEYQCVVNRDHVSKLFKEVPFWETEEWRMEAYNNWWNKAIEFLPY